MLQNYKALSNQNIYDVCQMAYGTLDMLFKLMLDNNFAGVNYYPSPGQIFVYDDTLILNQNVSITNKNQGINYATRASSTGGQYYYVNDNAIPIANLPVIVPPIPAPAPVGPTAGYFYVLFGSPNIGIDGSGNFTYRDSRLIGLSGYSVFSDQLSQMLYDNYLSYEPLIGRFTINIPAFSLISGSRLQVFLNLVTI
jgi:hypothetical protein